MGWFSRRNEEKLLIVSERQSRIEKDLRTLQSDVSKLTAALVVREPATATAAEAYDGLRKAVMAGPQARRQMLVQLVELTDFAERNISIVEMRQILDEQRKRAGLVDITDGGTYPELFEIVEGSGELISVRRPAWVDEQTGQVIQRGTAVAEPKPIEPEAMPVPESETEDQSAEIAPTVLSEPPTETQQDGSGDPALLPADAGADKGSDIPVGEPSVTPPLENDAHDIKQDSSDSGQQQSISESERGN
ncbi:MAG TPA: hypothetical protein DHW34_05235 [Actinobacteria bacterium]|nr:hypothetical protein [Actinomycetota bacterium]HCK79400.1 hypothetical protein [Actinomycetota bacterium]